MGQPRRIVEMFKYPQNLYNFHLSFRSLLIQLHPFVTTKCFTQTNVSKKAKKKYSIKKKKKKRNRKKKPKNRCCDAQNVNVKAKAAAFNFHILINCILQAMALAFCYKFKAVLRTFEAFEKVCFCLGAINRIPRDRAER